MGICVYGMDRELDWKTLMLKHNGHQVTNMVVIWLGTPLYQRG